MKQNSKKIGDLGEELVCKYLKDKGYTILERNYWKKFGEIDIIAERHNVVHFVEVKTISYETKSQLEKTLTADTWQPEEMVHQHKLHQIEKASEAWLSEVKWLGEWSVAVAAVKIVPRETYATVKLLNNVA